MAILDETGTRTGIEFSRRMVIDQAVVSPVPVLRPAVGLSHYCIGQSHDNSFGRRWQQTETAIENTRTKNE